MKFGTERRAVLEAARRTERSGLTHGTSGNVSCRAGDGFVITPTGRPYETLGPDDIVAIDAGGGVAPGSAVPSVEWPMHRAIYLGRPDVAAVVHVHAPAASAFSCLGVDLPPFHYMVAAAGGDSVRTATYAPFGTDEIGDAALEALVDRSACFLAHHGLVAVGANLGQALMIAEEVEFLADLYLRLRPGGEPPLLSSDEMDEVLERFQRYQSRGR